MHVAVAPYHFQVTLAFPTNQFGHQENSEGQEILNVLQHVRPGNGFEPKSVMLDKVRSFKVDFIVQYIEV